MLFSSEVTIGFESTVYDTTETRGEVRVCAVVFSPTVNSPTTTPIGVFLSFSSGTAGNPIQNQYIPCHITKISRVNHILTLYIASATFL